MRFIQYSIGLLLCQLPLAAVAQNPSPGGEEEHRYQFTAPVNVDAATEKIFLEAMAGFDPRMHVNIDPAYNLMKVLTYQEIDPDAVVELALQFGIIITSRRVGSAPENPMQQE